MNDLIWIGNTLIPRGTLIYGAITVVVIIIVFSAILSYITGGSDGSEGK